MHSMRRQRRHLLRARFRKTADRVTEVDKVRILRIAVHGDVKTACMAQGLQHGQGILIGTAVLRSSERENAELDCHTGYSIKAKGVAAVRQPRTKWQARTAIEGSRRPDPAAAFMPGASP